MTVSKKYLFQIYLPLQNSSHELSAEKFLSLEQELTAYFGGVTAFTRSPAKGRWKSEKETYLDDIVIFEVLTETNDEAWWGRYRKNLEERFLQEVILITRQDVVII